MPSTSMREGRPIPLKRRMIARRKSAGPASFTRENEAFTHSPRAPRPSPAHNEMSRTHVKGTEELAGLRTQAGSSIAAKLAANAEEQSRVTGLLLEACDEWLMMRSLKRVGTGRTSSPRRPPKSGSLLTKGDESVVLGAGRRLGSGREVVALSPPDGLVPREHGSSILEPEG